MNLTDNQYDMWDCSKFGSVWKCKCWYTLWDIIAWGAKGRGWY